MNFIMNVDKHFVYKLQETQRNMILSFMMKLLKVQRVVVLVRAVMGRERVRRGSQKKVQFKRKLSRRVNQKSAMTVIPYHKSTKDDTPMRLAKKTIMLILLIKTISPTTPSNHLTIQNKPHRNPFQTNLLINQSKSISHRLKAPINPTNPPNHRFKTLQQLNNQSQGTNPAIKLLKTRLQKFKVLLII